jgi:hypothetical protein
LFLFAGSPTLDRHERPSGSSTYGDWLICSMP